MSSCLLQGILLVKRGTFSCMVSKYWEIEVPLFPVVPIVALTATSSALQRRTNLNCLCFNKDYVLVAEPPDTVNMKITKTQETCPQAHPATSSSQFSSADQHVLERSVSDTDRFIPIKKTLSLFFFLCDSNNLISSDLMHGLTDKVINDIIEKYFNISIPDDIMNNFEFLSGHMALQETSAL